VDSISTSAAKEDHVSMGGMAARKCLQVVENVEVCIAVEILGACQALEFRRPLKTTPPLEAVYALVRSEVKDWDADRYFAPDIEAVHAMIKDGRLVEAAEKAQKVEADSPAGASWCWASSSPSRL
jgi:histidine ammonia-lyase